MSAATARPSGIQFSTKSDYSRAGPGSLLTLSLPNKKCSNNLHPGVKDADTEAAICSISLNSNWGIVSIGKVDFKISNMQSKSL